MWIGLWIRPERWHRLCSVGVQDFEKGVCVKQVLFLGCVGLALAGAGYSFWPKAVLKEQEKLGATEAPATMTSSPQEAVTHSNPANPAQDAQMTAEQLEDQIAGLQHEIERGEYVRRINDPGTSPEIKQELRARIRLYVRMTLEQSRFTMHQLDRQPAL